jgi:hypothetical protein
MRDSAPGRSAARAAASSARHSMTRPESKAPKSAKTATPRGAVPPPAGAPSSPSVRKVCEADQPLWSLPTWTPLEMRTGDAH